MEVQPKVQTNNISFWILSQKTRFIYGAWLYISLVEFFVDKEELIRAGEKTGTSPINDRLRKGLKEFFS